MRPVMMRKSTSMFHVEQQGAIVEPEKETLTGNGS
jgi:hypothetical protein